MWHYWCETWNRYVVIPQTKSSNYVNISFCIRVYFDSKHSFICHFWESSFYKYHVLQKNVSRVDICSRVDINNYTSCLQVNMKIVSWNVNGLRSLKKKIGVIITELEADVACFQETKITSNIYYVINNCTFICMLIWLLFQTCWIIYTEAEIVLTH